MLKQVFPCSIKDCRKPGFVLKTRLCSMHYQRLRTHGDVHKRLKLQPTYRAKRRAVASIP